MRDNVDVDIVHDLPYGLDDRHRLDLFLGNDAAADGLLKPVLVFVHGGGFVGGDKCDYEHVGVWAARAGFVGVNIVYRLAPEHPWPAGPQDVGAAVAWLLNNIEAYGGDPQAIVLMGHSAGATHVASYVAKPDYHAIAGGGICGAILLAGPYDFTTYSGENFELYAGEHRGDPAASPMPDLALTALPLLMAVSEFDPPALRQETQQLYAARAAHLGREPDYLYLPGHDHMSPVVLLGADGAIVSERLVSFVRSAASTSGSRV